MVVIQHMHHLYGMLLSSSSVNLVRHSHNFNYLHFETATTYTFVIEVMLAYYGTHKLAHMLHNMFQTVLRISF
jgi:hypothetical protein